MKSIVHARGSGRTRRTTKRKPRRPAVPRWFHPLAALLPAAVLVSRRVDYLFPLLILKRLSDAAADRRGGFALPRAARWDEWTKSRRGPGRGLAAAARLIVRDHPELRDPLAGTLLTARLDDAVLGKLVARLGKRRFATGAELVRLAAALLLIPDRAAGRPPWQHAAVVPTLPYPEGEGAGLSDELRETTLRYLRGEPRADDLAAVKLRKGVVGYLAAKRETSPWLADLEESAVAVADEYAHRRLSPLDAMHQLEAVVGRITAAHRERTALRLDARGFAIYRLLREDLGDGAAAVARAAAAILSRFPRAGDRQPRLHQLLLEHAGRGRADRLTPLIAGDR